MRSYEDVKKNIETFLNDRDLYFSFLNQQWVKKVSDTYRKLVSDISLLEKEEEIPDKKDTMNSVFEIVLVFMDILTNENLSEKSKDFIKDYCLLIQNWDTEKKYDLTVKLDYIHRFFKEDFTMLEALLLSQRIQHRIISVQEWLPPSINISKHYLNVLMEKE
jgi:hypothetical protein